MKTETKIKKLNFRTKPIGATAVEYMIMLILIALFIIGIMRVFGGAISEKFVQASGGIEGMSEPSSGSAANGVGGEAAGSGGAGNGSGKGSGSGNGSGAGAGSGSGNGGSGSAGSAANGAGKGGKGGGAKGKGSSGKASGSGLKGGKKIKGGGSSGGFIEEEKSGPGINPIVLLVAMALLGLLIYVMVANKKGG